MSGDWDATLRAAFELLLGRRIGAGEPAEVYYGGDTLDEFLLPARWLTPQALASSAPVRVPDVDATWADEEHEPLAWRYDLAGSRFAFDDELRDRLPEACFAPTGVSGAQLTALGVDLAGRQAKSLRHQVYASLRIATDGTLFDAMRQATFTAHGPEGLLTAGGERAAARWEEVLAGVGDERLRDHLRLHALDDDYARSTGACYVAAGYWPPGAVALDEGYDLIAGWEFGESQGGVSVVSAKRL
ncbi:hypothetical protein OHA72_21915 [Dactylosporangium sp. NBC_01737]|uniref:hypothetical protein n=1 Tax=Dactylosporangium sp. NBC_01737 TaxID=2975959 RepID=UPI002E165380|nr:hypothetical protein OHA72_21915 [Dactylosporangium sp. NBC_01737]